ncbi:hypothetical protein EDC96DRAFT_573079 [Choanephora cucurbitarum]|nr:hypothetical protein EDC96DRAFT_573079 [Choanephora cucurbitarum]
MKSGVSDDIYKINQLDEEEASLSQEGLDDDIILKSNQSSTSSNEVIGTVKTILAGLVPQNKKQGDYLMSSILKELEASDNNG